MRWQVVFCVMNAKGGVAKTTSAVNIGAMAVAQGKPPDRSPLRALVIDVDNQMNATQQFGIRNIEPSKTLAGNVSRESDLRSIIIHNVKEIEGLDLIPSHPQLAYAEEGVLLRGTWLRRMLRPIIPDYDLVIIDCPADFGLFTVNALAASNGILIPTHAEVQSASGLPLLLARANQIFQDTECEDPWAYVVITCFNETYSIEKEWEDRIMKAHGDILLSRRIRRNTDVQKAVSAGLPIMLFNEQCTGYEDYWEVTHELLDVFAAMKQPAVQRPTLVPVKAS